MTEVSSLPFLIGTLVRSPISVNCLLPFLGTNLWCIVPLLVHLIRFRIYGDLEIVKRICFLWRCVNFKQKYHVKVFIF